MLDFSLMAEQPFGHASQHFKSLVLRVNVHHWETEMA